MIIFYCTDIADDIAVLRDEEARHCSKVLRRRVGDELRFTDGMGYFYDSKILEITRNECKLLIKEKFEGDSLDYNLTIAVSPVKNMTRFEWFVEKAVEIGVTNIVPLICERTEKRNIKEKRLNNILISASKQSLKANFPLLQSPVFYSDFIESVTGKEAFIAHLNDYSKYLGKVVKPKSEIIVLVGPEGDFTENELNTAFNNGVKPVSLGSSRLRTETAAMVSCQIVNTINEISK